MRVVIEPPGELYRRAARLVAEQVRAEPASVLGLATGRTMLPLYEELARLHHAEGLSLARVTAFALDEYVGVADDEVGSFRHFLRTALVERTDLPAQALHLPAATEEGAAAAAPAYEAAIRAAGGVDLQLLGLGVNAHLGFNEPGSSLASRTRVKALAEETRAANRDTLPGRARMAITMGLGTIREAKACALIATGAVKAAAVAAAIEGPVTASAPASVLQLHPQVTAYVDEAAATGLVRRRYYEEAEALQRRLEGDAGAPTC
ncbi:MAG: glucosamine-6-phosphate deaminase [Myxococcota bacterium]